MAVDSALSELTRPIEEGQPWPRPVCPKCQTGHIGFSSPIENENHDSVLEHHHPDFEPEWISGTFIIRGQCENPGCRQAVHGTGDYCVGYSQKSNAEGREYQGAFYSSYYELTHLHPPMLLMSVPTSAPAQVHEGVRSASRVLLADPGLAATALRATVERFLTSDGISAVQPNGRFKNAHERILEWRGAKGGSSAIAELFFAVKWLGNAGTHEDSNLTTMEVLEGAKVLNEAFHRLFTGLDIDAYAQNINAAKGPLR